MNGTDAHVSCAPGAKSKYYPRSKTPTSRTPLFITVSYFFTNKNTRKKKRSSGTIENEVLMHFTLVWVQGGGDGGRREDAKECNSLKKPSMRCGLGSKIIYVTVSEWLWGTQHSLVEMIFLALFRWSCRVAWSAFRDKEPPKAPEISPCYRVLVHLGIWKHIQKAVKPTMRVRFLRYGRWSFVSPMGKPTFHLLSGVATCGLPLMTWRELRRDGASTGIELMSDERAIRFFSFPWCKTRSAALLYQ